MVNNKIFYYGTEVIVTDAKYEILPPSQIISKKKKITLIKKT